MLQRVKDVSMQVTKVEIQKCETKECLAIAAVILDNTFLVKGIEIKEAKMGTRFISFPSYTKTSGERKVLRLLAYQRHL